MIHPILALQDGRRLWKASHRMFWASLFLMPKMLWYALIGHFNGYLERVEDELFSHFALDMSNFDRKMFHQNPMAYTLGSAEQLTTMIWFTPDVRYAMSYRLALRLGRYWAWREGLLGGETESPEPLERL